MSRRSGRGRLSSIDLLPEHADGVVQKALAALAERKKPQVTILNQLNFELAALDPPVEPISKSAFNRFSIGFSAQARRLTEAREAAAAMAERMDDMPEGDVGLLLGETIKSLLNDVLVDGMLKGDSPSIKQLQGAADALHRLERARRDNAETAKLAQSFIKRAADAVERAASETGLTGETIEGIKREILGVRI